MHPPKPTASLLPIGSILKGFGHSQGPPHRCGGQEGLAGGVSSSSVPPHLLRAHHLLTPRGRKAQFGVAEKRRVVPGRMEGIAQ